MKIIQNIPEAIKGAILITAGFALLFHTLGILKDFLWYALLVISLYLILLGFVKVGGIQAIKGMFRKKNKDVIHEEEYKKQQ